MKGSKKMDDNQKINQDIFQFESNFAKKTHKYIPKNIYELSIIKGTPIKLDSNNKGVINELFKR